MSSSQTWKDVGSSILLTATTLVGGIALGASIMTPLQPIVRIEPVNPSPVKISEPNGCLSCHSNTDGSAYVHGIKKPTPARSCGQEEYSANPWPYQPIVTR
jgi:hypothetical protein